MPQGIRRLAAATLVTLALAGGAASAQTWLDAETDADAFIFGATTSSSLGWACDAFDVDGDGGDDLLVTGFANDTAGVRRAVVQVFRCRASWPPASDTVGLPPDLTVFASSASRSLAIDGVGDLDGDGRPDLVLSSFWGTNDRGRVHVLFDSDLAGPYPRVIDLATPVGLHVQSSQTLNILRGRAADLDGDGRDDLVISSSDSVARNARIDVLRGRAGWPSDHDLATQGSDFAIVNLPAGYAGGQAATGDLDGDGIADLAAAGSTTPLAQGLSVFLGRTSWPATWDFATRPPDVQVTIDAVTVAIAIGDVTGDGRDDLVAATTRQEVVAWAGGPGFDGRSSRVLLRSEPSFGFEDLADLNGDGVDDLLIARRGADGARNDEGDAGEVLVVHCPVAVQVELGESWPDVLIMGSDAGDFLDQAAIGDLDCDGNPDLVATTSRGDGPNDVRGGAGDAYVFLSPSLAPAPGPELFVDGSFGLDTRDGSSWSQAKATLEAALTVLRTVPGPATVHVAEGTQRGHFRVGAATKLLGGYAPGGGERDPTLHATVLDGSATPGTTITVYASTGVRRTHLDGLVVTGGDAEAGGGILANGGDLTLSQLVLRDNTIRRESFPASWTCFDPFTMMPVEVFSCADPCLVAGAAVAAQGTRLEMFDCLVVENRLLDLSTCFSAPSGCFTNQGCQAAPPHGGAVYVTGGQAPPVLRNVTIAHNNCTGLRAYGSTQAPATVSECILFGNEGSDLVSTADAIVVRNSLVGATSLALDPSNLRDDPAFVDPAGGDYRLSQTAAGQPVQSPAVDAGGIDASDACSPLPPLCLDALSTRTDGVRDVGRVDLGWHAARPNQAPIFAGASTARASGDCAIEIAWEAADDLEGDAVSYRVFRAASSGAQDFGSPVAEVGDPAMSWLDTPVPWGTTWYYVVRAVDSGGREEANVVEVTAQPADATPPFLVASASATGCDVTLPFQAMDDCSGFAIAEVHRSSLPSFTPDATTLVGTAAVSPATDVLPSNGNWWYRLVAHDAAGNEAVTPALPVRASTCGGALPVPGEAFLPLVRKVGGDLRFTLTPADGADFHRLHAGQLLTLSSGYTHAAGIGPDRLEGSDDDVGACTVGGLTLLLRGGVRPGAEYYLAVGVNASGEGLVGVDSLGRSIPHGAVDCP